MATTKIEENDLDQSEDAETSEPVASVIATLDYMQAENNISLEVSAIDENHAISLNLQATLKKSNEDLLTRIQKSLNYIFTGKFDAEYTFTFVGISEINSFLNNIRSVTASVKRQSDRWRWKL